MPYDGIQQCGLRPKLNTEYRNRTACVSLLLLLLLPMANYFLCNWTCPACICLCQGSSEVALEADDGISLQAASAAVGDQPGAVAAHWLALPAFTN
jgi:hypothetical protein